MITKKQIIDHPLSQQSYKDLTSDLVSDIRCIFSVAFDTKHYDPRVLRAQTNMTGVAIYRMKIKLNHMCEVACELLNQIKQDNTALYDKITADLKQL